MESLGGEGAVLAVANALQLQALGVEHSQKRARQASTLDGPDALILELEDEEDGRCVVEDVVPCCGCGGCGGSDL